MLIVFTSAHLRSTQREDNPLTFHEAAHLEGDVDMFNMVKALLNEEYRRLNQGENAFNPNAPRSWASNVG